MSARAGIVVTGTEVLTGIIPDLNGPWLSERLRERGVDLSHTVVVGDRPADVRSALEFLASTGVDVIITSGGLGPTADDLTADVVGAFAGRPMMLDEALEGRIAEILERLTARRPDLDRAAIRAGNRKQAMIPARATVLEPVGTAPGLVVPPAEGRSGPVVLVLPGPPPELRPMWETALETPAMQAALAGAGAYEQRMLRLFGIPESEIAETLRVFEREGMALDDLEITTCLRRGEIEIATVFAPAAAGAYAAFEAGIATRHADTLFSTDGSTIDEQVAALLLGPPPVTVAAAESCTGGLMAARLTARGGSSAWALGGIVAYADEAKSALAGVPAELIAAHGAVSPEVAAALADGGIAAFGAQVGIGITGVAGPGGGTAAKPVGMVCLSVARAQGERLDRTVHLPGGRDTVRERTTTVVMHLLRRLLGGGERART